ncbi:hypothetical protein KZ483_15020 [Paenibacillus sp. sptzw28]|uniref:hypothetical protein n=1 Tax=Paenibacillus sp. sptzw28 TaxID=715179 RepID=UPI001C6E21F5|nr:hypothetical protein KZ483_15020 [Paenibacillus sp. sptzw28]
MFIIRGYQHGELGVKSPISMSPGGLSAAYDGADGVSRELTIVWSLNASRADCASIHTSSSTQAPEMPSSVAFPDKCILEKDKCLKIKTWCRTVIK